MRLAELHPKWISLNNWASSELFAVGMSFLCPHCQATACPTCKHVPEPKRLAVMFWPPVDPSGLLGRMFELPDNGGHRRVSGESFETLTISPSIGFDSIGHWHGHITKGAIV